jgi:cell shape-determining protein MreC
MKHTKIVQDGIIRGLGFAQIDPEETKKVIEEDFKKSEEFKSLEKKKKTLKSLIDSIKGSIHDDYVVFINVANRLEMSMDIMNSLLKLKPSEAIALLNAEEIAKREQILAAKIAKEEQVQGVYEELIEISNQLEQKRRSLIEEKAVYFEDSEKEKIIEDAEYTTIKGKLDKLKPGQVLKEDLKIGALK